MPMKQRKMKWKIFDFGAHMKGICVIVVAAAAAVVDDEIFSFFWKAFKKIVS